MITKFIFRENIEEFSLFLLYKIYTLWVGVSTLEAVIIGNEGYFFTSLIKKLSCFLSSHYCLRYLLGIYNLKILFY